MYTSLKTKLENNQKVVLLVWLLTGEVADCFMIEWDKEFIHKCKTLGINLLLYSRFKDDIFVAATSLEKGTAFVNSRSYDLFYLL